MDKIEKVKWSESAMQIALTRRGNLFDFTRYTSVPNVSYALLYSGEADLVCMSRGNVFHEVEIKISVADMKNEGKKYRSMYQNYIAYKWIAAPAEIVEYASELECIPKTWGIVSVSYDRGYFKTKKIRNPKRQNTEKVPESKIAAFYRTGVMRMWSNKKLPEGFTVDPPVKSLDVFLSVLKGDVSE